MKREIKTALQSKLDSLIRTAQILKQSIEAQDIYHIDNCQVSLRYRLEEFDYLISKYEILQLKESTK